MKHGLIALAGLVLVVFDLALSTGVVADDDSLQPTEEIIEEIKRMACITWFQADDPLMNALVPFSLWYDESKRDAKGIGIMIANDRNRHETYFSSYAVFAGYTDSSACPPNDDEAMWRTIAFWRTGAFIMPGTTSAPP